jgi:hypothetical protein
MTALSGNQIFDLGKDVLIAIVIIAYFYFSTRGRG